jgi:hypothetical protein
MERERSGKVIAIATLIVGIIGLSLGFAAFSTSLNITSSADVPVDASVWKVGFSTVNSAMTAGTVNGQTNSANNGTLNLTQFVISQANKAQLATTNGSKVEYDFYIVNDGSLDAYLNSVTMGTISCAYQTNPTPSPRVTDDGHTTITPGTGTISDADCQKLFGATLEIGSSTYTDGQAAVTSGFGNTNKLAKPSGSPTYVAAKLTIAYKNDSLATVTDAPNGDFTVSLSDSTVVYGSTSN